MTRLPVMRTNAAVPSVAGVLVIAIAIAISGRKWTELKEEDGNDIFEKVDASDDRAVVEKVGASDDRAIAMLQRRGKTVKLNGSEASGNKKVSLEDEHLDALLGDSEIDEAHTSSVTLAKLIITEKCSDLACVERILEAKAKVPDKLKDGVVMIPASKRTALLQGTTTSKYVVFGFTISRWVFGSVCIAIASGLLFIVAQMFRQTSENGGIPEYLHLFQNQEAWSDPKVMRDLLNQAGKSKIQEQGRVTFKFLDIFANRPWKPKTEGEDIQYWFGSGCREFPEPDMEWLAGEPFPNGETRKHSIFHTTLALWSFMGKRTSFFCCVYMGLRGATKPLIGQLTAWAINELQTGTTRSEDGIFSKVPGSPSRIVMYYVACIMALFWLDSTLQWLYGNEVPWGGSQRKIQIRLQRKLHSMGDGETAKQWPAGRCDALIFKDIPNMMETWVTVFDLTKELSTILTSLVVFFYVDAPSGEDVIGFLTMFLIVIFHTYSDLYCRMEILLDMAKRQRLWKAVTKSVCHASIHHARKNNHQEWWDDLNQNFFDTSFIKFYRDCHMWFVQTGAARASNFTLRVLFCVVAVIAGDDVINGHMDFSQFTSIVVLMGIFASALRTVSSLYVRVVTHHPSVLAVAEALNVDLDFTKA